MKRLLLLVAACSHPVKHDDHPHHEHHHRFEHADEWAKQFDDPARDAWQQPDKVVAAMQIRPGMTVADVGAGTGYFESRLSAAVGPDGKVMAVDIEPDMVRYINERRVREKLWNVEAHVGLPDDPKLAGVDRILIVDTWHHIADRTQYAKKLAAALKPGGSVFVVDFKLESEKGPPKEMRLLPAQVMSELTAAEMTAKVVDVDLPDQYVVTAAK